jgi:DNA-directed RNA polymerase I subunit RPA43
MGKRKSIDDDGERKLKKKEKKRLAKAAAVPIDDTDNRDHEFSCLQRKRIRLVISLLPAALADIERAIHISLRQMLLKYSDSLGGVLLAYDNMTVEKETGAVSEATCGLILNELPHIHFRVIATMLIFSPDPGKKLRGIVNESFPSHIGILAYSFFNAMISAYELHTSGFKYHSSKSVWKSESGQTLNIGDTISFTVEKLHECNGIISLECVALGN